MRRSRTLHFGSLAAGLLAAWLPIDTAVAGWWHHHHAVPLGHGPMPAAPCGGPPAPWAGWEHAVIIDDRTLVAPAPVFVAPPIVGPVVETITPVVCEHPVVGWVVTPATEEVVFESAAVEIAPEREATPTIPADSAPNAPARQVPAAEVPVAAEKPAAEEPAPLLEPRDPVTLQGESPARLEETGADTFELPAAEDEPPADATPADDADAFDDGDAMEEEQGSDEPAPSTDSRPKAPARNLFDEAPTDEEAAEMPVDEAPPVDAFEAPADDDGFGIPDEPPMSDAFEGAGDDIPADDVGEEMPADDGGFEAPADETMEEGMGDETPADESPADDAPAVEEPAAADPFDSSSLRTPGEPSRNWRDDTGRHATAGRLVEIRAGSVRILKITGRHTTVPIDRLSDADRDHVAGVRRALVARRPATADTAGLR